MRITLSAGMRFVAFPALVVGLTALAAPRPLSAQSIKPGQSEADVRAAWGEPLTVRKIGRLQLHVLHQWVPQDLRHL